MKKFAEKLYKSTAWQQVRDAAWRRDRCLCQDCLKRGRVVPAEEVHHIIPVTADNIDDATVTLNLNNLVSLCKECHKARHSKKTVERRYKITSSGNVVARNEPSTPRSKKKTAPI